MSDKNPFKAGDIVVCVGADNTYPSRHITNGKQYKILNSHCEDVTVINDLGNRDGFYHWRFKKVDEQVTLPYLYKM
jgi:hypothetical protein